MANESSGASFSTLSAAGAHLPPTLPPLTAHGGASLAEGGSESQGGSGTKPQRSSSSPTSFASLNSDAREADASVAFWALTHASFPTAALLVVKEKLFRVAGGGTRPISHRKFKQRGEHADAFGAARTAFCAATLDPLKHPAAPKSSVQRIDFSPGKKYTSRNYEELEIDCLLKVPEPTSCHWTRDPAQFLGNAPIRVAPTGFQDLPESGAAVAAEGALAAAADSGSASPALASATRSRFSQDYYPDHSAMYVVGEVYAPTESDGARVAAQKLLQAERVLRFLCAKEGKGTRECVLGMVFLGPSMGSEQSVSLFCTLQHYKDILPCLWELHNLARLLCCRVRVYEPAVEIMRLADAVAQDRAKMQEQLQLLREQQQLLREQLQLQHEQQLLREQQQQQREQQREQQQLQREQQQRELLQRILEGQERQGRAGSGCSLM
jgi:hypothetical protein